MLELANAMYIITFVVSAMVQMQCIMLQVSVFLT